MGRRLLLKRLLKNRALGTRSWNPHLALSLHQFCSHSLIGSAPAFELLLCLAFILLSGQRLTSRVCVPYNFSPTAEMLPGNSSQGLSPSCISAISIVMPPSVCMSKAETALRMKGRKKPLGREL